MTDRAITLYPAIDILDGKAVRLVKGDFDAKKVYDEDPLQAAAAWVADGASHLHVVDLDGAREGVPRNLDHVGRIVKELKAPVQLGGGLRTLTAIEEVFAIGVDRVILGTSAFTDPHLLGQALVEFPGRVLVSVDVRGGRITTEGWTQTVDGGVEEVIAQLARRGAWRLVYTSVDRDGMLKGPNLAEVRQVAQALSKAARANAASVVYSGGIGAIADLESLASLKEPALEGVIVGKALYEQRFTVAQALQALATA